MTASVSSRAGGAGAVLDGVDRRGRHADLQGLGLVRAPFELAVHLARGDEDRGLAHARRQPGVEPQIAVERGDVLVAPAPQMDAGRALQAGECGARHRGAVERRPAGLVEVLAPRQRQAKPGLRIDVGRHAPPSPARRAVDGPARAMCLRSATEGFGKKKERGLDAPHVRRRRREAAGRSGKYSEKRAQPAWVRLRPKRSGRARGGGLTAGVPGQRLEPSAVPVAARKLVRQRRTVQMRRNRRPERQSVSRNCGGSAAETFLERLRPPRQAIADQWELALSENAGRVPRPAQA